MPFLGERRLHFLEAAGRHGAKLHARGALEEDSKVGRLLHAGTRGEQTVVGEQDALRRSERTADDAALVIGDWHAGPFRQVRATMEHRAVHMNHM